jgi:FAD binding domain
MPAFAGMTGVVNSSERHPSSFPRKRIQNLSISRRQQPEFKLTTTHSRARSASRIRVSYTRLARVPRPAWSGQDRVQVATFQVKPGRFGGRMTEPLKEQSEEQKIVEVHSTSCCIVGGGPAGLMLATLLARKKVPVLLLEQHQNFDRDFRGDTVHPSTLNCSIN